MIEQAKNWVRQLKQVGFGFGFGFPNLFKHKVGKEKENKQTQLRFVKLLSNMDDGWQTRRM